MKYIYIGDIVNTHGLKGEVRLISDFEYKKKVFKKGFKLYIGRTTNLKNRIEIHFRELKSGKHTNEEMLNDYKVYGREKFEVYLLEENVPFTERKKEFKYMEEYGTYNKKYGYNYKDASKRKKKEVDIIKGLPINMFANMHKNNCEKEKEE